MIPAVGGREEDLPVVPPAGVADVSAGSVRDHADRREVQDRPVGRNDLDPLTRTYREAGRPGGGPTAAPPGQ